MEKAKGPRPIDTHFHFVYAKPISETAENFRRIMDHLGLGGCVLQALSSTDHRPNDPYQNIKGLYLKSLLGEEGYRVYLYGAPYHFHDGRDSAERYLEDTKRLYAMGADGYKSLDGKPGYRKALGRALDDELFEPSVDFIERMGMPAKIHMCDPRKFWGRREELTENQIKRGWWYGDGSYPSFDGIYSELEGVLSRHPSLKLTIAHFGYITNDEGRCEKMLGRWKGLSFDLTPGASMFASFSADPDYWKDFFDRNRSRIFFGSDTYNNLPSPEPSVIEKHCERICLVRRMLESSPTDSFEYQNLGIFKPMALSEQILRAIYEDNVMELLGDGRPIDSAAVIEESERLRSLTLNGVFDISEEEKDIELSNIQTIIDHFKTR